MEGVGCVAWCFLCYMLCGEFRIVTIFKCLEHWHVKCIIFWEKETLWNIVRNVIYSQLTLHVVLSLRVIPSNMRSSKRTGPVKSLLRDCGIHFFILLTDVFRQVCKNLCTFFPWYSCYLDLTATYMIPSTDEVI